MDKKREIQVIDRSDDFDRTETFQKKVADKNKINLAELILNATNRQIEDKKTVEAKATGYLAFAALILAIIAQLFPDVINTAKENNCLLFGSLTFVLFILTFVAGIGLIIICASILLPKEISYFPPDSLMDLYQKTVGKGKYDEIDDFLIQGSEEIASVNTVTLKKMDTLNMVASVFLLILIGIFIMDIILYFVFLGI